MSVQYDSVIVGNVFPSPKMAIERITMDGSLGHERCEKRARLRGGAVGIGNYDAQSCEKGGGQKWPSCLTFVGLVVVGEVRIILWC